MGDIIMTGVDLTKSVFQLHGVDAEGRPQLRRQLRRSQMHELFRRQPPCLIGMEACASAHYWARELGRFGHDVQLMQPSYVKGYMKRDKTDKADAEAICEAVSRPSMRFVPVKSEEAQAVLMTHKVREFLVRQQTQIVNALCAHLGNSQRRAPDHGLRGSQSSRARPQGAEPALRSAGRHPKKDRGADR